MRKSPQPLVSRRGRILAAAGLAASQWAVADSANTAVGIGTNVIANCISTATPINFGTYDTLAKVPLDAIGVLTLTCTQDATPSVVISLGNNPLGGVRRMSNGSGSFLPYSLLTPTSPAPNASCSGAASGFPSSPPGFALAPAPSTVARTFNVCARIASGVDAPTGNYSDTVLATVSF